MLSKYWLEGLGWDSVGWVLKGTSTGFSTGEGFLLQANNYRQLQEGAGKRKLDKSLNKSWYLNLRKIWLSGT